MGHLAIRDTRAAVRALEAVAGGGFELGQFGRRGLAELPRLVPCELATLSACDLVHGRRTVLSDPPGAISDPDLACFDRHFHAHPLVRYHASHPDGPAHRISDSMADRDFRRTALYNEYYRRVGIDRVIALPLWVDDRSLVSFVLNRRGRDFSDGEAELLNLLRRPLAGLFRGAQAVARARAAVAELRAAMATDGWETIPVDASGRIAAVSAAAGEPMRRWWHREAIRGAALPDPLSRWLHQGANRDGGFARWPLQRLRCGDREATVRACPDPDLPGGLLLFLREGSVTPSPGVFSGLALTPRERDVLGWVAAGKTNEDIATIAGISRRTVEKHLQRVFIKLGVENRTAAVMRARSLTERPSARTGV